MNRWSRPHGPTITQRVTSRLRLGALAAFVACVAGPLLLGGTVARAQVNVSASAFVGQPTGAVRSFPATARRGVMEVVNAHEVRMNGTLVRLAPGSRIRSTTNALLTTGPLVGQTFLVNYTLDVLGQPLDIWILTEREAAERRPGSDDITITNIVTETAR